MLFTFCSKVLRCVRFSVLAFRWTARIFWQKPLHDCSFVPSICIELLSYEMLVASPPGRIDPYSISIFPRCLIFLFRSVVDFQVVERPNAS
jgi:hypothetical protein